MLAEKTVGTIQVFIGASAGCRHMLCHPSELHVAQVVELVQFNGGLQLQLPGGQTSLKGLEPGWREQMGDAGDR